ncbi:hypothetical protein Plhal703r1_c35g0129801 [Plasmopara halstedii]
MSNNDGTFSLLLQQIKVVHKLKVIKQDSFNLLDDLFLKWVLLATVGRKLISVILQ